MRWIFEQSFRDDMEQGFLEDPVAGFREASNNSNVPEDVTETFCAEAQGGQQEPQHPEIEAMMDEIWCGDNSTGCWWRSEIEVLSHIPLLISAVRLTSAHRGVTL
jgi:hypothetical protein